MYPVEVKICSKNGWFTPQESRNYYGRYDRSGVCVHWWGDGTGADNHDNIVNYISAGAANGQKSANYVLSDNKITMLVDPDNVAWCQQSGNATEISIEHQPTLGAEGYKKSGWLVWQLEKRYGRPLALHPHNYWYQTACPGTISLDRIRQEANKWASGVYGGAPAPTPPPTPAPKANLEWVKFPSPVAYITNKQPTNLWNFNQTSWSGFGSPVKSFDKGAEFVAYGRVINHTLGAQYLVTEYSFTKQITNGVNEVDLTLEAQPTPPPVPAPTPPPVSDPEWVRNLRDIDDTKMWVTKDIPLINITTGQPASPAKAFHKDDEFDASAVTKVGDVEYRITQYSFDKKIFNGLPISALTLTPPGTPDVPPVPSTPPPLEDRVSALEKIVNAILDALASIGIHIAGH